MRGQNAVIFVKTLREQRLREALQHSAQAVRRQERRLRQARNLRVQLMQRQLALQQHRGGFSGSAGDLLACDAALASVEALVGTASDTVGLRLAELRELRAHHALHRQRWHAAQEGLRLASERLRLQGRRNGALRAAALEDDLAETRASATRAAGEDRAVREGAR